MTTTTLKEACAAYIDHMKQKGQSPSTCGTIQRTLALLIEEMGEAKEVGKILPVHVDKFFKSEKATVIGKGSSNGINLSLFNPFNEKLVLPRKALLSQLSLEGYFVFSFVGRIVDRKGIVELY